MSSSDFTKRIGGEHWAGSPQPLEEKGPVDVALERDEVRLLPGRVAGQRCLVVEHRRRAGGGQRHHLGDHDAFRQPRVDLHQLLGERLAADERDVGEEHLWPLGLHLLDEARRGAVGGHHHHRLDAVLPLQHPGHCGPDIGGVALVRHLQHRSPVPLELAQRPQDALVPGVSKAVVLGEDCNLLWPDAAHLHQVADDGRRLLEVTGAVVENGAVGRVLAKQRRPGERREEEHLTAEGVGERDRGRRRTDISNEAEDAALLGQLPHDL